MTPSKLLQVLGKLGLTCKLGRSIRSDGKVTRRSDLLQATGQQFPGNSCPIQHLKRDTPLNCFLDALQELRKFCLVRCVLSEDLHQLHLDFLLLLAAKKATTFLPSTAIACGHPNPLKCETKWFVLEWFVFNHSSFMLGTTNGTGGAFAALPEVFPSLPGSITAELANCQRLKH